MNTDICSEILARRQKRHWEEFKEELENALRRWRYVQKSSEGELGEVNSVLREHGLPEAHPHDLSFCWGTIPQLKECVAEILKDLERKFDD